MMHTRLEDILFKPELNKDWHMQLSERAALMHVLSAIQPQVSIEIGTFLGGSLRPISAASEQVYTFDIDPNQHRDPNNFPNVTFITGDSAETIPPIIDKLNQGDQDLSFILVDGSHDEDGVRKDLTNCLEYIPKRRPTIVLVHDSANPAVRRGISGVDWRRFYHVHSVNVDFVPGLLFDRKDIYRQMWGGLAAIVVMPQQRRGGIEFESAFSLSYEILKSNSAHNVLD